MSELFDRYKDTALRALGYHDYTPRGLMRKILEKAPSPADRDTAKQVVVYLHGEGYINERAFLEKVLADCEASLYGPLRVRQELVKRDFSPKSIRRALSADVDYTPRAVKLLKKQSDIASRLADPASRNSLVRMLSRYGYPYDVIRDAVEAVR